MRTIPFILDEKAEGRMLHPVDEGSKQFSEAWLQSVLHSHPEILPAAAIEPIYAPLVSIGREIATKAGPIDNLFVSHHGYLTLVETKLWRNPEARREVVAQAMDYAHALSQWSYDDLDAAAKKSSKKGKEGGEGLHELVARQLGPVPGGKDFFVESIEKNLRLGRFLVLVVGDKIRESAVDIASYVNRHPGLALNMALVELQCFHLEGKGGWPLVIVPRVVKRSEIVERSVVEVTIVEGKAAKVSVGRQASEAPAEIRRGGVLTEDAFWALLRKSDPKSFPAAKGLIDSARGRPGILLDSTAASLVVKFDDEKTGRVISLFHLKNSGILGVWPRTLERQLADVEFPPGVLQAYVEGARTAMGMPKARAEYYCPLATADLPAFQKVAEGLIAALGKRRAEG